MGNTFEQNCKDMLDRLVAKLLGIEMIGDWKLAWYWRFDGVTETNWETFTRYYSHQCAVSPIQINTTTYRVLVQRMGSITMLVIDHGVNRSISGEYIISLWAVDPTQLCNDPGNYTTERPDAEHWYIEDPRDLERIT